MFVKYTGGRSWMRVSINRGQPYFFTKENNHTIEIKDQRIINHIFGLDNSQEFEVIMDEVEDIDKELQKEEIKEEFKEEIILKKKIGRPKKEK